jgi:uncharacterized protein
MAKTRPGSEKWYRITVKVRPGAARSTIVAHDAAGLTVHVAAPAVDNRANDKLVDLLAESLGVGKSSVVVLRGQTSRTKVIGIDRPSSVVEAWLTRVATTAQR